MSLLHTRLGIRTKLILLFVVIKLVPLVLLALLAWTGVKQLGEQMSARNAEMAEGVRKTVGQMSTQMSAESVRALDVRSREAIERLTTDTARAVADFLHDRDRDILLAATVDPGEQAFRRFLANRTRQLIDPGKWMLSEDGKRWVPAGKSAPAAATVSPANPENKQDFNYRPPEQLGTTVERPLYHEMTLVGLDGRERLKVTATDLLPKELRDISKRENTYAKAETYFPELKKLKPGEIYVSDVIGPYVKSHVIGALTPAKAEKAGIPFAPDKEAFAGAENPNGRRFRGIVRWATPMVQNGRVTGWITLALDHTHIMSFTDELMPTEARYTPIADASNGNYAFMWDYLDRSIAHPRHYSIVGFDPATGERAVPWLEASIYKDWQASGKPLRQFLAGVPAFDGQTREKKPAKELTQGGNLGLDCRYLNFAPQCQGWFNLTEKGGSGSFVILWSGIWKLTTAATIPYSTGQYGKTPRGFGYVTIGANVDEFHKAATATKIAMDAKVKAHGEEMKKAEAETQGLIDSSLADTARNLGFSTSVMVAIVIMVAVWLANLLTRRFTYFADALRRIEQGDLDHRLEKTGDDELGQLAVSINHMADSVRESVNRLGEARARAEEANRMKSSFLASMSHELRTPLNGILGFAELLELELDDKDQRGYAEAIRSSGEHLLEVVNQVLDLAKIEAGKMELHPEPMDLSALLAELARSHRAHAAQKALQLVEHYAEDLPAEFVCDATRLRQVMNNLLNNAIKFTDAGQVDVTVSQGDGHVRFVISDTGPGIPLEQQARIFEKFQQVENFVTRKHGGTGLGLALVKELVGLMGGEVHLESTPGKGTSVSFTLPLLTTPPSAPSADAPAVTL
jgi:signal transduction histidine kinase